MFKSSLSNSIAVLHILASGGDQFIWNVLRGKGRSHQVLRDLALMFPDILNVVLPWLELRDLADRRGVRTAKIIPKRLVY